MIAAWLREIWQGYDLSFAVDARRAFYQSAIPTQLVVENRGLLDSVVVVHPGKLLG